MTPLSSDDLLRENQELRRRLEDAEQSIRAIRSGEVDAVVIEAEQDQVYTLETPDYPYRLLVQQVPYPAATLTADGEIIACNRRFADLLQRASTTLAGHAISDFAAPDSDGALKALLRYGVTHEVQGQIGFLRDDGSRASACLAVSPLREGARGECLMITDVTEQQHYEELQRTQAALRASEERYRMLFESIDEGFCVVELRFDEGGQPIDYLFVETNPSFEHHTGLRDVVGKTMRQLEPAHEEHWFRIYGQVAMTGQPIRFQNRADALQRWYDVYAFRIGAPEDRRVAVLFSDITGRKRTEEALRVADRNKDEFLATLAHELRNPLAPLRNAVQILKLKGPPVPELEWARAVIDRQVQLMARLLEDLLDVSRISRNTLELRTERIRLSAVVEAAVETSRPAIDAGRHELTVVLPPEPIHLVADPVRLEQVFCNLLNNSAKYTEEGGRIELRAERRGSELVVSIRDNGIGIVPEMMPRIFDIFTQAKPALLLSQGGLGIGLSLVRGLVELHGGRIEATSAGPGHGSEFVIRLPITPDAPVGEPARPGEDEESSMTKRRVLIVDDNRDSADTLAKLLAIKGHEVRTAYDGEEGVAAAGAYRPEVVLLDIGMPKLSGHDACRLIREQPWGAEMYLIALTGWGQEEARRRTEAAGFNHHMVKPVNPVTLMQVLASLPVEAAG